MFTVRWVAHRNEEDTSKTENSLLPNADAVVASCLERSAAYARKRVGIPTVRGYRIRH